ncbi:MAG TPA: NAD(P)-dependent oxidoreductase [Acidimicrobiales bacterium]|nr:NAD(P)-dependent oxidoreductase [Acidimicrobiales bacterium]
MTSSELAPAQARRTSSKGHVRRESGETTTQPAGGGAIVEPPRAVPRARVTVYGCRQDEAALFGELAPRLAIWPTITDDPVSEANIGLARGSRCISVGHKSPVSDSVLLALREAGVRYLSTRSVGYDHIAVESAANLGILVENVAYSPDSVADFTLMLMLMSLRRVAPTLRRAQAHDYRLSDAPGLELRDLTVGVIGTGRIGAAVIGRLRGFGCRVLAYDRRPKIAAEYVPLEMLLQESDVVTLHAPLDAGTHHLLDRRRLRVMRRGSFVVNTGRGALVDTAALLAELESGRLGGAALDVLEGEEGIFYNDRRESLIENQLLLRLQRLPNVIVTPHTAYHTGHALRDIVESTLANCLNFERAAWAG